MLLRQRLGIWPTKDKMELANLAKETGIMTLNQINDVFGIEPFEGKVEIEGFNR